MPLRPFRLVPLVLLPLAACASMRSTYPANAPARAAEDAPERFLVGTPQGGGELAAPRPGEGCRTPMVDPRDGTRVVLHQSQAAATGQVGDYAVPEGRYGVARGELLRLDCGTGRVIGVVPRRG